MVILKVELTNENPPPKVPYDISLACSSYSDIKLAETRGPDLHYYEISWFVEVPGGIVKYVKRMLFDSFETAKEQQAKAEARRLSMGKDYLNPYYTKGMKKIEKMAHEARVAFLKKYEWRTEK